MLVSILLSLLSASFSFAEPHEHGPCKEDVKKLCADVKPGGGAIIKCMKEHEASLSSECKANIEKKKSEHKGMGEGRFKKGREACKADIEKFCKGITPGGGAIIKCLKEHNAELSEECKSAGPKRE